MQVNSISYNNYNNSSSRNAHPSFGIIKYDAAIKNLETALDSEALKEFAKLVDSQKENNLVDIVLFGLGKKKFGANISNDTTKVGGDYFVCKPYKQGIFQSPLKFFRKLIKIADKMTEDAKEIVAKKEILEKLEK